MSFPPSFIPPGMSAGIPQYIPSFVPPDQVSPSLYPMHAPSPSPSLHLESSSSSSSSKRGSRGSPSSSPSSHPSPSSSSHFEPSISIPSSSSSPSIPPSSLSRGASNRSRGGPSSRGGRGFSSRGAPHPPPVASPLPPSAMMLASHGAHPGGHAPFGAPHLRPMRSFFMSSALQHELRDRKAAVLEPSNPDDPRTSRFPQVLQNYHSFVALEPLYTSQTPSKTYGFVTEVYKANSQTDGKPYCIRRIDSNRVSAELARQVFDSWSGMSHPNIVSWCDVFSSKVISGVNNVFLVYEYFPCAVTLQSRYLDPTHHAQNPIEEAILWSYILQIVSALRAIHASGLAYRCLTPSNVLITGKNRVRLNSVGIVDALALDRGKPLPRCQYEDLIALGKLILSLATNTQDDIALMGFRDHLEIIEASYSADLKTLLLLLLKHGQKFITIEDVFALLAPRFAQQIDHLFRHTDELEGELSKEMENGRLFRIVSKLGFVNERPEFDHDPSWSETGNRYLLKLFRDYTFHQVNSDRSPNIDYAHVVETLNKLDVGSSERIVMSSRDGQSFLVVSYQDIRRCLEEAFHELLIASKSSTST